jgi:hypothetical protein
VVGSQDAGVGVEELPELGDGFLNLPGLAKPGEWGVKSSCLHHPKYAGYFSSFPCRVLNPC